MAIKTLECQSRAFIVIWYRKSSLTELSDVMHLFAFSKFRSDLFSLCSFIIVFKFMFSRLWEPIVGGLPWLLWLSHNYVSGYFACDHSTLQISQNPLQRYMFLRASDSTGRNKIALSLELASYTLWPHLDWDAKTKFWKWLWRKEKYLEKKLQSESHCAPRQAGGWDTFCHGPFSSWPSCLI